MVCSNAALVVERARKRADLLAAVERALARIAQATGRKRRPLRGKAEIGLEVGKVIDSHKMAKHFEITITEISSPISAANRRLPPRLGSMASM